MARYSTSRKRVLGADQHSAMDIVGYVDFVTSERTVYLAAEAMKVRFPCNTIQAFAIAFAIKMRSVGVTLPEAVDTFNECVKRHQNKEITYLTFHPLRYHNGEKLERRNIDIFEKADTVFSFGAFLTIVTDKMEQRGTLPLPVNETLEVKSRRLQ